MPIAEGYASHLGANAYMYPLGVVYATSAVSANCIAREANMSDPRAYRQLLDDFLAARQRAHRAEKARERHVDNCTNPECTATFDDDGNLDHGYDEWPAAFPTDDGEHACGEGI